LAIDWNRLFGIGYCDLCVPLDACRHSHLSIHPSLLFFTFFFCSHIISVIILYNRRNDLGQLLILIFVTLISMIKGIIHLKDNSIEIKNLFYVPIKKNKNKKKSRGPQHVASPPPLPLTCRGGSFGSCSCVKLRSC
jgi:hypothetical protein